MEFLCMRVCTYERVLIVYVNIYGGQNGTQKSRKRGRGVREREGGHRTPEREKGERSTFVATPPPWQYTLCHQKDRETKERRGRI